MLPDRGIPGEKCVCDVRQCACAEGQKVPGQTLGWLLAAQLCRVSGYWLSVLHLKGRAVEMCWNKPDPEER